MTDDHTASSLEAEDLCSRFLEFLPVTGASISVIGLSGHHSTICASDAVAARIDALQFELGEGPRWETIRTGRLVASPDLGVSSTAWPVFGAAAHDAGAAALFSFPVAVGAATVGVVELYHLSAGPLSRRAEAAALSLAGSVAGAAVR